MIIAVAESYGVGITIKVHRAPESGEILAGVDVLTPSSTEAELMLGAHVGSRRPVDLARDLSGRIDGIVVLTACSGGVFVQNGATAFYLEALRVESVVDTTGAGDAFAAAHAVALAEGRDLTAVVRFAAANGAHAASILEVIPSPPNRSDLESLLTSNQL